MIFSGSNQDTTPIAPPPPPARTAKDIYLDSLSMTTNWRLGGFDNVMLADVTIKNLGARSAKDFEITCRTYGESGTEINRAHRTLLKVAAPGKTTRERELSMGFVSTQSAGARCEITGFQWGP